MEGQKYTLIDNNSFRLKEFSECLHYSRGDLVKHDDKFLIFWGFYILEIKVYENTWRHNDCYVLAFDDKELKKVKINNKIEMIEVIQKIKDV